MRAWHCSALSVVVLLGACASGGGARPRSAGPRPVARNEAAEPSAPCRDYVAAWVAGFRGNVAHLDGGADSETASLRLARERLEREGIEEAACERPYCIIRPLGDGRLDSWCGYRRPDPSGKELYLWIPYR